MYRRLVQILLLVIGWCSAMVGQTPFDDFAPETSRIILDKDSMDAWRAEQRRRDTIYLVLVDDEHHWISVDPLVDKNIATSPYMYCNGNPVMLVDPDGREVINELDVRVDPSLFTIAQEHKNIDSDKSSITIYAHGSPNAIYLANGKEINTASQFEEFLSNTSDVWNTINNKSNLSIVLMSCNTGNTDNDSHPIAAKIANDLGVTVFAPTTEVVAKDGQYKGLFKMTNIDHNSHIGITSFDLQHAGSWRAFYNNKMIDFGPTSSTVQYNSSLLQYFKRYEK